MRAVIVQEDKSVKVGEVPVPSPGPKDVLLRIIAVGQNPTDWKHAQNVAKPGMICGCDFVGEVVELGSDVPPNRVKKGDIRWGFTRGGYVFNQGAFAEYVTVEWDTSGLVPPNITPQMAASIPIPFCTAVQALYLRLKIPEPPQKPTDRWILIWSGATSVGQYAIQLAKLSGLKVATTGSEARWPLLKSLGADLVVDYKDPDFSDKLKKGTNDSIEIGIDCFSEKSSLPLAQQPFCPTGGYLVAILNNCQDLPRKEVKSEYTLVYHFLSKEETPEILEGRDLWKKWCLWSTDLFEKGDVKPLEVEEMGGLDQVQKGFDIMKAGKHTCKLVYTV